MGIVKLWWWSSQWCHFDPWASFICINILDLDKQRKFVSNNQRYYIPRVLHKKLLDVQSVLKIQASGLEIRVEFFKSFYSEKYRTLGTTSAGTHWALKTLQYEEQDIMQKSSHILFKIWKLWKLLCVSEESNDNKSSWPDWIGREVE